MPDALGFVLGQIPSGLFILAARNAQGEETGMLASWVQQAAFQPPSVTVAINRKRYLADWLSPGSTVALSVLCESQRDMLKHFGRGFEPGEPAFSGLSVERTPAGLPALSDSLGWLEGELIGAQDAGDHLVQLVRLTAAGAGSRFEKEPPYVHVRKNGLGY